MPCHTVPRASSIAAGNMPFEATACRWQDDILQQEERGSEGLGRGRLIDVAAVHRTPPHTPSSCGHAAAISPEASAGCSANLGRWRLATSRICSPGPLEPGGKYAGFEGQVAAAAALAAAAVAEARARAQGGSGGGSGGGGGGGGSGRVVAPGSVTGADTSVDATGKRYLTPGGGLAPGLNFTSTQRGALLGEEKLNIPGA